MNNRLGAYENAFSTYFSDKNITKAPLVSWDIYGAHFWKLTSFKSDLKELKILSKNWRNPSDYFSALMKEEKVVVVTDKYLTIAFASSNMTEMNGYEPVEVIGKTPKIFQGMGTSVKAVHTIREAVKLEQPFEVEILNYRKDNSTYFCHIKGYPLFDSKNRLVNYIAFEQVA